MTRSDRLGKKTVQATVTVEKWRKLRHLVTETQRPASVLLDEAIDLLAEKYGQPKPPKVRKTAARRERSP
jgi:Ribbon-helix-helix domain